MMKSIFYAAALFALCSCRVVAETSVRPTTVPVSNTGWRLWLDDKASWQNDTLYLPEDVHLNAMPVNPPSGGWSVLSGGAGIPVSLPDTVEAHYWGKAPSQVINSSDPESVTNGSGEYLGVSWWYRSFTPPALKPGEHLVFSFPGARMRAEVYVNGQLCGYDVITETRFNADVTKAIEPGQPNTIAVRITNPGGNFSWGDFDTIAWGNYKIPISHGFGGLNCGVTMSIQGQAAVTDLAVLNHPDPRTITFDADITSTGRGYNGPVALTVARAGMTIWSGTTNVRVGPGGTATATKTVTIPGAVLWDIRKPALYCATAAIPTVAHSDHSQTFGFRWFTAQGVGSNAILTLNGRRIVVKSSISWGFWSPNGIFPDQDAAQREVDAVEKLGLNAIQNHRHMPKPIVLTAFDRAGLMRYCEAGAGCFTFRDDPPNLPTSGPVDTSGVGGEPTTFTSKYEMDKVLGMIREERSHPSAIIWSLQNEATPNHYNPKIYYTLHKMREADPSRIIMLESGFSSNDEVWALPYSNDLLVDHGKGSGWNDNHSAGDSRGVYQDEYYKSADDYKYNSNDTSEVRVWGEMATGASPDDHGVMAAWYKRTGITGYDKDAHVADDEAYENFIDKYGFRSAFPSADDLFRDAANMHYMMDAKMMENARMCDTTDYLVLSGWESTVVDNHSGMVDALRLLKADPTQVRAAAAPAALVVRAPHYVLSLGDTASVDVHLLNENVLHGSFMLNVSASEAGGRPFFATSSLVTAQGGNLFAQLLQSGITFTPKSSGDITVTATLTGSSSPTPVLTKSDHLYVVNTQPAPLQTQIAVVGSPALSTAIHTVFNTNLAQPANASVIVVGAVSAHYAADSSGSWSSSTMDKGKISGARAPEPDPGIYAQQYYGHTGQLANYDDVANGQATVTLYFVEPYWDTAGKRVFDVALNGQTVLRNFDIYAATGGMGIGVSKTFPVNVTNGKLTITIPAVESDNAMISAMQFTDAKGKTIRIVFGNDNYRDSSGNVWTSVMNALFDWSSIPADVLTHVHDDGARMVFLSNSKDASDVQAMAQLLAQRSILTFSGMIGDSDAPWLGRWYFGRQHWLLNGLPSNTVLDWQYQISGGNGLVIDAPGMEGVIGYGIHHDPRLGFGAAIIPYGKGKIVLFCIPGLAQSFVDGQPEGIDPVTATRIVYNALAGSDAPLN